MSGQSKKQEEVYTELQKNKKSFMSGCLVPQLCVQGKCLARYAGEFVYILLDRVVVSAVCPVFKAR